MEKLQNELHMIGDTPKAKHTIFVDSKEDKDNFSATEFFQTVPEALDRAYNRPKVEDLENAKLVVNKTLPSLKVVEKSKEKRYMELRARMARAQKMRDLVEKMELKKHLIDVRKPYFRDSNYIL